MTKVIFWISTGFIFLFEGVMPALTGHGELSVQAITHLGYPVYFVTILVVFKVLGSLALIIPKVPARIKEWAYAGCAINFICAFISNWVVDGLNGLTFFPMLILAILIASYIQYHRLANDY